MIEARISTFYWKISCPISISVVNIRRVPINCIRCDKYFLEKLPFGVKINSRNLLHLSKKIQYGSFAIIFSRIHTSLSHTTQHHSKSIFPGPASHSRVGKSSTFLSFSSNFDQFFLKLYLFSSSFWPSGWACRPPGKALATPLHTSFEKVKGIIVLHKLAPFRRMNCLHIK